MRSNAFWEPPLDLMSLLRVFIALDIPANLQRAIRQNMEGLQTSLGNSVRWVPADKIHLTLKFIGDIPPAHVASLSQAIVQQAGTISPFDISIGGFGVFPDPRRARVLWVGVQAPAALEALRRGIETGCAQLGYSPDGRPFSPHLTVGRVRDYVSLGEQQRLRKALGETKIDSLGMTRVNSVHLYQSELKPDGSIYTKLFSAPLKS